ncbi:polyadenylate-binding protein-interacting protein 1 isoform X2 [Cryptotermes secundus]|uniref:polyadenylate-binding protein-interacting protein 1 isoform X2 n=1 Tax=Cryptotermes secundus TaxID=105785 RepID=UPI000CD7C03B|nr:polyadenylate-binding protein-interacting protein 1 isoform X2 [Cryptotermes secundus]
MNPVEESSVPKGRGRGIWQQGQNRKELRRPQTEKRIGIAVNSNNVQLDPDAEENISKTSKLSVNAEEFYPRNVISQQPEESYSSSLQCEEVPHQNMLPFQMTVIPNWSLGQGNLQSRLYSNWSSLASCSVIKAAPEGGNCSLYNSLNRTADTRQEQFPTDHLIGVMQHLTLNPGTFDDLITPLVDTFGLWLGNAETLSSVVNVIVEQSIMEPNFRYSGARLCNFLNNEFPPGERSTFRTFLLNRCQQEHAQISNYIYTDPGRLHGYVLFMAELFMQLECAKGYGQRIEILGKALLEALSLLLSNATSGNIKCICQVLKLAGQPLDAQDQTNMNQVMESLLHLLNSPVVESDVRRLVSSVVNLRHVGWVDTSNFMPHASTTQLYNPYLNEPVFYGPDGQIITQEESQFLQESVCRIPDPEEYDDYGEEGDNVWEPDDEMDEEIQVAFEQFLQMGKNHSKDTHPTDSKCNG